MADFEHFPFFEEDMNIIQKLGDYPGTDDDLSSAAFKEKFDKGGNLLKEFVNHLVNHLNEMVNMLNNSSGGTTFTGGTMLGSLNMNGKYLYGLNDPTADDQAANKSYVDSTLDSAKEYTDSRITVQTVTLLKYGWTDNLQTLAVTGVTADQTKTDVDVAPDPADDNWDAYMESGIRAYAQGDGTVQFKCTDVPSVNVTVNVKIRRAAG